MISFNAGIFNIAGALDNKNGLEQLRSAGDDKAENGKLNSSQKLRDDQQKATSRGVNGLGGKVDVSV